ncbi:head-tail joining protein [Sediminicoccus rosea]|uniref:Uncharacterized protein n=1 Tax=Sediminicoccus rosea TaxID=1225128 RepID=A0ABZ0PBS2_9PROT|nr:hypothetical protein [Sediminicoccus rosea]WPB83143.1 hypothetical protein R9Z33_13615 [Sediminicoccus rosea]
MSAFAAAMDTLAADPNIGTEATYRAGGTGAPVLLRVVRSAPDRLGDAFSTSVIQASAVLTVAISVLSAVEADDTFTLGADTLTVQHAERDAAGIAWRVFCRR